MSELWTILVAALLLLLIRYMVAFKRPSKFPPGPKFPLPILGDVFAVRQGFRDGFIDLQKHHGKIFSLYLGPKRFVVICDLELMQEAGAKIDMTESSGGWGQAYLRGGAVKSGKGQFTPPGVIFASGSSWLEQRRFCLQALRDLGFDRQTMESCILAEVAQFCRHMENISHNDSTTVQFDLTVSVLNSLWAMVSGERMNYDDPKLRELVRGLSMAFKEMQTVQGIMVQRFELVARVCSKLGLLAIPKAFGLVQRMTTTTIRWHMQTFQEESPRDLIDHYLAEIKRRTDANDGSSFCGVDGYRNLNGVILDFFIAGSESTTDTLSFGLLYMIGHPDVQTKVQDELDRVVGRARLPSIQDRANTPYTEAVIHEIQRLACVTPFAIPRPAGDMSLSNGKYNIPKGTMIFFYLEGIMKDPDTFPQPEKFDPTRFLDNAGNFVPHPHVLPFGAGKRRCLGENLGRMSVYLFLTAILSRFRLEKTEKDDVLDYEPQVGVSLAPKPFRIKFVVRE